jgi:NhaA family Na+:H+ antiporter
LNSGWVVPGHLEGVTAGKRVLLRVLALPIRRFFNVEAASGLVLLGGAIVALAWANSPLGWVYRRVFEEPVTLVLHGRHWPLSPRAIVSDGLMTFFFFLVGMEIKREAVEGELRSPRRALLPALAALGGMLVPALVFRALVAGTAGAHGWGIPMATDIAFTLGTLKLMGRRVPRSLIVFVTALAIFDDVGGILVIALFYGRGLHPAALAAAAAIAAALIAAGRARVRRGVVYAAGGLLLWAALDAAGIHPAIAGVVTGLAVPGGAAGDTRAEPLLDRFIRLWHPWVAFGIMPLFALASSGVRFTGGAAPFGRVTAAAAGGLLLGKQAGVFCATFAAVKTGLAPRPAGASWTALYGVSVLAGIGFTVALFIAEISFPGAPALLDQARAGILVGSVLSAAWGLAVLARPAPSRED